MNVWLYIAGALLTLVAMLFVVVPLIRYRTEGAVSFVLPGLLIAFPVAVFAIYSQVSTYPAEEELRAAQQVAPGQVAPVNVMVRELAERMETEPTVEGMALLGQTYITMQRYEEAIEAWHSAWEMTQGQDPDISIGYAEALILADRETLATSAVDLLDFALQERPDNAKALWYGGLSAAARNMPDLAVERWTRLLNENELPDQLRLVLQQQLAALGADIPDQPAAASGAVIQASIDISPELAEQGNGSLMLFLIARDMNQPRPPLAVKRVRVSEFPLQLALSDADQMVPGRSLADVEELEIVARISFSGDPIAASGDLFGQTVPQTDAEGNLRAAVTIDTVVD